MFDLRPNDPERTPWHETEDARHLAERLGVAASRFVPRSHDRGLNDRIEQAVSDAFVDHLADAIREALRAELPRVLAEVLPAALREMMPVAPDLFR